jgi:hypothetical protein
MRQAFVVAALALALGAPSACRRSAAQGHAASAEREIPPMTVDELATMLLRHETVGVYDANGRGRYEQGHIPSARHVGHDPVTAAMLPQDRATRLVFYCANEH